MTDNRQNGADETWLEYLHAMQSLSAEMKAGLAALAGNDLQRFETSVAVQERLCETARGLFHLLRRDSPLGVQPALTSQPLAAAGRELRQQSRIYSAVLPRAARVGGALLSLYQESPRGYSRDGRGLPAANTWSCEV